MIYVCDSCGEEKPLDAFLRRNDQPWFVPAATRMAQAAEPLLPRVINNTCHMCFGLAVLSGKEHDDD